ncbi:right-handed parallel beta-helix repeat-containing protein [Aureliella helgolandensis]|uniref:right-handed parallel beta-helix repeat-containing protein n=1 Tax=Aureliella helgolandensis TaxID=2527968 RepID=UPI0018CFEF4A|nr:right-handed parallel beta-helix repeat-containing protein [Aureliella helgolandensis]
MSGTPFDLSGITTTLWVDQQAQVAQPTGAPTSPFAEISSAVALAGPGTEIVVRDGVYREELRLPAGTATAPVVLRAADGATPILSGSDLIDGWTSLGGGVYETTISWEPTALYIGGEEATNARHPDDGWWTVDTLGESSFVDSALIGLEANLVGSEFFVWTTHGNTQFTVPITGFDSSTGTITYDSPSQYLQLAAGDSYWLQNDSALVSQAGEWAWETIDGSTHIVVQVEGPADLAQIESPRRRDGIQASQFSLVEGFSVRQFERYGVDMTGANSVTIATSIVEQNGKAGVWMRGATNLLIEGNQIVENQYGMIANDSRHIQVVNNEVAYNAVDGIIISWGSTDVLIEANYIHHHLDWGHPDGIQLYRDVSNVRIIDNVIAANGQSMHIQEADDVSLSGNTIYGSSGYLVSLFATNSSVDGNTLAFSGYGLLRLPPEELSITSNVFNVGHGKPAYVSHEALQYEADENLYWNSSRALNPMFLRTAEGWQRNWDQYQSGNEHDQNSAYGNPEHINAPIAFDSAKSRESTHSVLALNTHEVLFEVGDFVEVNFDGVQRQITAKSADRITIFPPLEELTRTTLVANWGTNSNFNLDLRTSPSSPLPTAGSTLNIGLFQSRQYGAPLPAPAMFSSTVLHEPQNLTSETSHATALQPSPSRATLQATERRALLSLSGSPAKQSAFVSPSPAEDSSISQTDSVDIALLSLFEQVDATK